MPTAALLLKSLCFIYTYISIRLISFRRWTDTIIMLTCDRGPTRMKAKVCLAAQARYRPEGIRSLTMCGS